MDMKLPSTHQIGDQVTLPATVVGVSFDEGKVSYAVRFDNPAHEAFVPSECVTKAVKP